MDNSDTYVKNTKWDVKEDEKCNEKAQWVM